MGVIKFKDSDTGESGMDVVSVPEGFSLQLYPTDGEMPTDYISIILSKIDAFRLTQWMLQEHRLDPRLVARVKAYPIEGSPGKFRLEINGEMQSEVVDESNLQEAIQKLVDSHA
jgi:hypothetical protein